MPEMINNKRSMSLQSKHSEMLAELERYKLLVENVQDYAIFFLDSQGYIQTWNKGAERNKGYKASEIIGKHFSIFYPQYDKDAKKPEWELEEALRVGRGEEENWRIRKDGSRFWANVVITALFNNEGEHVGFAKVTRNLTDRKRQEDSLRETNILLEQQQEDLKLLNASKDEFISLASHQLRTPATGVKQYVGMLLEGFAGEIQPHQYELLKKAYESNERQLRIVSDLLKVAQVDAGKVQLRLSEVRLHTLIKNVIKEQQSTFDQRRQSVVYEISKSDLNIRVDEDLIRMVLENILSNASKYSEEGKQITVSAEDGDKEVKIHIQDEGVGIDSKDRPRMFEKFSRIDNPLSMKVGGTGLGLYWAKKITDLHSGKIVYSSNLGAGTTFTIILPRR